MPDRVVRFVLDQLVAFYTLRREFDACMSAYTSRLREEGAKVEISSRTRAPGSYGVLRRPLRVVSGVARWLSRIPMYTRQYALMKRKSARRTAPDVVVATSAFRLHSDQVDARGYFVALTKPFYTAYDPGVHRDIAAASRLLISDVVAHSPLWTRRHACWDDKVFIVDTAFVLYLGMRAVVTLRAPLLLRCLRSWPAYRKRRGAGHTRIDALWELLAAGLLLEGYRRAMPDASFKAYFLTSNSFGTEILRFQLFVDPKCDSICELMHGVPTTVYERYIADMLAIAERSGVAGKHSSVSQLPDLPMFGVLTSDVKVPAAAAINTYLNRYWAHRGDVDSDIFVEGELRRLLAGKVISDRTLVVTFVGGNSQYRDPHESEALLVERLMIQHTVSVLDRLGQSYVLVYTPHPCYGMEPFLTDPFFAESGVVLFPDTVLTWLVCDLAIGLISSALFEAAYFGAHAFTPTVPSDGMYPALLLDRLHYPATHAGEGLADALSAFLERFVVGREPCDLLERATMRARRSSGVEALVPVVGH